MTESQTPGAAHAAFNALCDGLDDYEPLPTRAGAADSSRRTEGLDWTAGSGSDDGSHGAELSSSPSTGAHLDAEILAGLVNP